MRRLFMHTVSSRFMIQISAVVAGDLSPIRCIHQSESAIRLPSAAHRPNIDRLSKSPDELGFQGFFPDCQYTPFYGDTKSRDSNTPLGNGVARPSRVRIRNPFFDRNRPYALQRPVFSHRLKREKPLMSMLLTGLPYVAWMQPRRSIRSGSHRCGELG